jgi:hypothetical protein
VAETIDRMLMALRVARDPIVPGSPPKQVQHSLQCSELTSVTHPLAF